MDVLVWSQAQDKEVASGLNYQKMTRHRFLLCGSEFKILECLIDSEILGQFLEYQIVSTFR